MSRRMFQMYVFPLIAVVVATVIVVIVDPPSNVKARVVRPFITGINPCQMTPYTTVDVAGRKAVARSLVQQAFEIKDSTSAMLDPAVSRIQSVKDDEGTDFLVLTQSDGTVSVIAFDSSGFPVQRVADDGSPDGNLKVRFAFPGRSAGSEPLLIPAESGFYIMLQGGGNAAVGFIDTERMNQVAAGNDKAVSITELKNFDLSNQPPGFAAALGRSLVVSVGGGALTRLKPPPAAGGEWMAVDRQISFAGRPALVPNASGLLLVSTDATGTFVTRLSPDEDWRDGGSLGEEVARLDGAVSVIAGSRSTSELPSFVVDRAGKRSVLRITPDEGVSEIALTAPTNGEIVGVASSGRFAMVMTMQMAQGSLSYVVIGPPGQFEAAEPPDAACLQKFGSALSGDWLRLVAARNALESAEGPYLYLSHPMTNVDCVLDTREAGTWDASNLCGPNSGNRINRLAAPVLTIDALQRIVIEKTESQAPTPTTVPTTDTTVPPTATNVEPPAQSVSVECGTVNETPAPAVLETAEPNGSSLITARWKWTGGAGSCQPNEFVAFSCVINESTSDCDNMKSVRDRVPEEKIVERSVDGLPGKAGRRNKVWVVAFLNGTPSQKSNELIVDLPVSAPCAPRGLSAVLSRDGSKWVLEWEDNNSNKDCDESDASSYQVKLVNCGAQDFTAFPIKAVSGTTTVVSAVGDDDFSGLNLRGQPASFAVRAVSADGKESRFSDATPCRETTTSAVATSMERLQMSVSPLKKERKLRLVGTAQGGAVQYRALTQAMGTSSFDTACVSWTRGGDVVGSEECVPKADFRTKFEVTTSNVACTSGKWNLTISPRGPEVGLSVHDVTVPVEISCDFVFSDQSAVRGGVDMVKNSAPDASATGWTLDFTVADLGYDIDDLGSELAVTPKVRCDTWDGRKSEEQDALSVQVDAQLADGSARVQMNLTSIPAVASMAGGCSVSVTARTKGVDVTVTAPIDLTPLSTGIAQRISDIARARLAEDAKTKGTFTRSVPMGSSRTYVHRFEAPNVMSCPKSDFTVTVVVNDETHVCNDSSISLSWNVVSVEPTDAPMSTYPPDDSTVPPLNFAVTVSAAGVTGTGNTVRTGSLTELKCRPAGSSRNWCADPRRLDVSVSAQANDPNQTLTVTLTLGNEGWGAWKSTDFQLCIGAECGQRSIENPLIFTFTQTALTGPWTIEGTSTLNGQNGSNALRSQVFASFVVNLPPPS